MRRLFRWWFRPRYVLTEYRPMTVWLRDLWRVVQAQYCPMVGRRV